MTIDDKELASKIATLLKNFLKLHETEATENIGKRRIDYTDLYEDFDIFNKYISWYATKEGAPYYYFLNLRWVIALAYLCHEHSKEYDNFCLGEINKYYRYSIGDFGTVSFKNLKYTKGQCQRKYMYYTEKIKKISEIFGN